MANVENDAVFTDGSLMRHVAVMSFTASIGLMAMFAVDLVDMIFISMLGNEALAAAVGYAGTLMFFTNSINIGLSIAAGALVARAIGAGKRVEAREYASSVAVFSVLIGLIVPVLVLANLSTLLGLLGAEGVTRQLASDYLWIILPSMSFTGVAMTGMAIIRAHGDARRAMYSTLSGGIVNAILDPLLFFGLGLGLEGAAIASVFARLTMLIVAMYPAIRRYDGFAKPNVALIVRDFKAVTQIAVPSVLTNIATPVGSAIVVREMAKYGTEAVAGMAVVGRLVPVAFAVIFALSGAIGPIIGQNFGAEKLDRVRKAFSAGLLFILAYTICATIVLFILRGFLSDLFEARGVTRSLIFLFCGPLALSYIFTGAIFVSNAAFNNLGHPMHSTWINWGKNTIGTLPFVLVGSAFYGAEGVLIGQALGSVVFGVIAVFFALRVIATPKTTVSPDPFASQKKIHQLFGQGHR